MQIHRKVLAACVTVALAVCAMQGAAAAADAAGERNAALVRAAFDRWLAGDGFFDQLPAPDSRWIVHGSGPLARTYAGREGYIRDFVRAFAARLEAPVKPTIRRLVAQDDVVVALWDGEATARDGVPYRNHYAWVFRMENGKAVEIEIFLDLATYQGVIDRVPAPAAAPAAR